MRVGAASATPSVLKARASPLAPPAKAAQTSPLPTVAANAGPVSPLATTAAAPLAGTALGSPGVMAAIVVLGLVMVGALVWQRRVRKRELLLVAKDDFLAKVRSSPRPTKS